MEKLYQGENLNFVFRCLTAEGNPYDMSGKTISALLRDSFDEILFRFSTATADGVKPVRQNGHLVLMSLSASDTSRLEGRYVLEVKVRDGDLVMIEMEKSIKFNSSVIGKDHIL